MVAVVAGEVGLEGGCVFCCVRVAQNRINKKAIQCRNKYFCSRP